VACAALLLAVATSQARAYARIIPNEGQRLRRQVGFSDVILLATVRGIDTLVYGPRQEPITGTILHLRVEKQLLGPRVDSLLDVTGPERPKASGRGSLLELVDRNMGLRPGARQILLLRVDPRRGFCLTPGGLMEVRGDTIVVESKWAGRRWLDRVAAPLVEDGVPVGEHLRVTDMEAWLKRVEDRARQGLQLRRASLIAGGRIMAQESACNVPREMRCFVVRVDTVFSANDDSIRVADDADTLKPTPDPRMASTFAQGARRGQLIRVMLSATCSVWSGYQALLWLEPGPINLWVPAFDGAGFQPVKDGIYLRSGARTGS
jgi:hypothetical protein